MAGTTYREENRTASSLGAAQLAWAMLIAAGIVYCLLPRQASGPEADVSSLDAARHSVLVSGAVYLATSMLSAWRIGRILRRYHEISQGGMALLATGHLAVAVAAGWVLLAGPESKTLLVSLDRLVAALATVAAVSAVLSVGVWRVAGYREKDVSTSAGSRRWGALLWPLANLLAALAVTGCILLLESRPFPSSNQSQAHAPRHRPMAGDESF